MKRFAFILAICGSLSACAVAPVPVAGPDQPGPSGQAGQAESGPGSAGAGAQVPADGGASTGSAGVSSATRALLTQSQAERDAGDWGGAAATVERALTISPDEALLWVELAEIRMAQGDSVLAQEMARKALTLAGRDTAIADRARRLIAN